MQNLFHVFIAECYPIHALYMQLQNNKYQIILQAEVICEIMGLKGLKKGRDVPSTSVPYIPTDTIRCQGTETLLSDCVFDWVAPPLACEKIATAECE